MLEKECRCWRQGKILLDSLSMRARGENIENTRTSFDSVGLTHKLYLTKLLHSVRGQTTLRSVILDM